MSGCQAASRTVQDGPYHGRMPETQIDVADDLGTGAAEEEAESLRFDDPYWDDAFCAWWDPTLRTCCS
jgi:hypothetical protein